MKKILVTGGAGFIGSHTCICLLEKGYEVVLFDSFINSSRKVIKRIIDICKLSDKFNEDNLSVFEGDLRNKENIEEVFNEFQKNGSPIKGVIHFAGLKSVTESLENPILYWDANVKSSINLLEIMQKYSCNNMVFSSSATIYGLPECKLVDESSLIKPLNPYGVTKYVIEMLISDIFKSDNKNLSFASLRYFNPAGAHHSGLIGENPKGTPTNIFPLILDVASGKLDKLNVYGDNWPTKDGTGVRDYIHVMDIAESHLKTMEFLFANESKNIHINLGTGKGTSVLELINVFQKVNHIDIPYQITERRLGDAPFVVANNDYAASIINWKPSRSIDLICKDGWNWRLKNPNGY